MERILNDYLKKIDKHLKPMSISERIDIVAEIKSTMSELMNAGNSAEEIIARLGNPRELARAYLGEAISKDSTFNRRNVCSVFAFYSLASATWIFILPLTSILGISMMCCSIITPIAGVIKLVGYMMGYDIKNIQFSLGSFSADALTFLPISIVLGVLFFFVGKLLWNLTIKIIKGLCKSAPKIKH